MIAVLDPGITGSILVDAALKSVLVLLLAMIAAGCLKKHSAAARHLVWFLAMASLPLLPLLSWLLPSWQVLPRWMAPPTTPAIEQRHQPAVETTASETAVMPEWNATASRPATVTPTGPTSIPASASDSALPSFSTPSSSSPSHPIDIPRAGTIAWIAGATLALLPTLLGLFSLWRLERNSRWETTASWLELLRELIARLKFKRPVALLKTDRRSMPMTWGVLRPKLLLPENSREWSEDRRRVVLLHELAHAKRWDYATNLVTRLVCALYWFNPLVWFAARQMTAERERACDDIVLRHGAQPVEYAEQLLQIAASLPVNRFAACGGIAMARPSGLEDRMRAILDAHRNRRAVTRLAFFAMAAALTTIVVPMSMMKAASEIAPPPTANRFPSVSPIDPDNPLNLDDDRIARLFSTGQRLQQVAMAANAYRRLDEQFVPNSVEELYRRHANREELGNDPFGAGKLRLEQLTGKLRVYSVGPDGVWNGGQLIDPNDPELKGDVGVELKRNSTEIEWLAKGPLLDYLQGTHTARYLARKGPRLAAAPAAPNSATDKLKFGPVLDGLSAAAEMTSTNGTFTFGSPIELRFYIRNETNYAIQIAGPEWRQGDELIVEDQKGNSVQVSKGFYSGESLTQRAVLKPGETTVFKSAAMAFLGKGEGFKQEVRHPIAYTARVGPGQHTIRFRLPFRGGWDTQLMDWRGELETGPVVVDVQVPITDSGSKAEMSTPARQTESKPTYVMPRPQFGGEQERLDFALAQSRLIAAGQIASVPRKMPGATVSPYSYQFKVSEVIKGTVSPGETISVVTPLYSDDDPSMLEAGANLMLFLAKSGSPEQPIWMTLSPSISIQPATRQNIDSVKKLIAGGPAEPFNRREPGGEQRTALDVRISAITNWVTPVPIKTEYGIMFGVGLPVRIENHSDRTIRATIPHVRHIGPLPKSDLGAAAKRLGDPDSWWIRNSICLMGESLTPATPTVWRPGDSHEFILNLSWGGTNTFPAGRLIRPDVPANYAVLVSLMFQTENGWEYTVSPELYVQTLPEPQVEEEIDSALAADPRHLEPGWGEPFHGVSVRLQADKVVWKNDETPQFNISVRNLGPKHPSIGNKPEYLSEFEVDGKIHAWDDRRSGSALTPGNQRDFSSVTLSTHQSIGERKLFPLSQGKHTVRVAVIPTWFGPVMGKRDSTITNDVRIFSNPVEIEVLPSSDSAAASRPRARTAAQRQQEFQETIHAQRLSALRAVLTSKGTLEPNPSQPGKWRIVTSIPGQHLRKLKFGQSVSFTVDGVPNSSFEGRVRTINGPSTNAEYGKNYSVSIDVDSPDRGFRSAMRTEVVFLPIQEMDYLLSATGTLHPLNGNLKAWQVHARLTKEEAAQLKVGQRITFTVKPGGIAMMSRVSQINKPRSGPIAEPGYLVVLDVGPPTYVPFEENMMAHFTFPDSPENYPLP